MSRVVVIGAGAIALVAAHPTCSQIVLEF